MEMQYNGKKAYVYPADSQNRFLELSKNALSRIGFDVSPVDKSFYKSEFFSARESYVVVNWAEDFVYPAVACSKYEQSLRFLKTAFLIIFSKVFAKKLIWVRHNFKPHNSKNSAKRYKAILLLYKFLKVSEVSLEDYYSTPSLIHPLYLSDGEIIRKIDEESDRKMKYEVIFFGAVKRYKNLHNLLKSWPSSEKIKIAGFCDDTDYKDEILKIIESRNLKVDWDDRFLSDEELSELLENSKFVLLPHSDGTMISSGTFYHAISYGCNVLVTESQFGFQKSSEYDFVHLYEPGKLSKSFLNSVFVRKSNVYKQALKNFGENRVIASWNEILEKI